MLNYHIEVDAFVCQYIAFQIRWHMDLQVFVLNIDAIHEVDQLGYVLSAVCFSDCDQAWGGWNDVGKSLIIFHTQKVIHVAER